MDMPSSKHHGVHWTTGEPEMTPNRLAWCPNVVLRRSTYIPCFAFLLLLMGTTYLSSFRRERLSFLPSGLPANCSKKSHGVVKDSVSTTTNRFLLRKLRTSFKSRGQDDPPFSIRKHSENSVLKYPRTNADDASQEGDGNLFSSTPDTLDKDRIQKNGVQRHISVDPFAALRTFPTASSFTSEGLYQDNQASGNLRTKNLKKFDKWTRSKKLSINFKAQSTRLSFSEKTAIWKTALPYKSADVNIMAMKPLPFMASYKNPCWVEHSKANYSGSFYTSRNDVSQELAVVERLLEKRRRLGDFHRVRCLPYFLIIGQPKCGSTDLYRKVIAHPDVCNIPEALKEPHWWARARLGRQSARGHVVSLTSYVDLFDYAGYRIETESALDEDGKGFHNKITGEGSMSTFWDNDHWWAMLGNENTTEPRVLNPDYIHHLLPDAKLILILRNPTQRMYSDFLYFRNDRKMPADFHKSVVNAVLQYQACMREETVRNCAYNVSVNQRAKIRLRVGMYSVFLQDWLRVFSRKQLFIVRTEDYARDPQAILTRLYAFLGLRSLSEDEEESILSMKKANTRRKEDVQIGDMLPETRQLLDAFYKPYNEKLAQILDDDSFLWKDPWS